MRKLLLAAIALAGVSAVIAPAVAGSIVPFGTPPNAHSPAAVAWLTPNGVKVTPGLTRIYPNFLGVAVGVIPGNYSWGATSPGVVVYGFPVR